MHRELNESEIIGLCSVDVIVNQPNSLCVKATNIIHTSHIPLGLEDLNGNFLSVLLNYHFEIFHSNSSAAKGDFTVDEQNLWPADCKSDVVSGHQCCVYFHS